ncbi:MAG: ABC transporter substrate-binding protein [Oscillospiraceae bacterium]|nr:ABC transporter substrate-binding protein [Oscillospiraceae bacterium]
MKLSRILSLALAGTLSLSLLAGCGGGNGGDQPANNGNNTPSTSAPGGEGGGNAPTGAAFKLGGIGPLTGGNAIYGNAAMNGAKIAVDEINALGGDIQFDFNPQDDVSDAETSVNAYNSLKDWGMQALVGTVTTGPCISVSAEAFNDRIFALTPSASSTDVINGKDNMFQVCFTDPNQGTGAADYISENLPGSKIAVIYQNDNAYSQGIRDTFVAEAAAKNLEIVSETTFTEDTQNDFSVQIADAQSKGADVVFLPIYYTPASVILTQAKAINYAPTFFGVDGMDGILTVKGFDTSLAEGVMLLTPFSADAEDERTQNFVSTYNSRHGETPNQFAADGYDAVYVIYEALKAANCTPDMSPQDICEALVGVMPTISVDGLTGAGMTWDASGAVSKAPMAVVIKDGVYVTP